MLPTSSILIAAVGIVLFSLLMGNLDLPGPSNRTQPKPAPVFFTENKRPISVLLNDNNWNNVITNSPLPTWIIFIYDSRTSIGYDREVSSIQRMVTMYTQFIQFGVIEVNQAFKLLSRYHLTVGRGITHFAIAIHGDVGQVIHSVNEYGMRNSLNTIIPNLFRPYTAPRDMSVEDHAKRMMTNYCLYVQSSQPDIRAKLLALEFRDHFYFEIVRPSDKIGALKQNNLYISNTTFAANVGASPFSLNGVSLDTSSPEALRAHFTEHMLPDLFVAEQSRFWHQCFPSKPCLLYISPNFPNLPLDFVKDVKTLALQYNVGVVHPEDHLLVAFPRQESEKGSLLMINVETMKYAYWDELPAQQQRARDQFVLKGKVRLQLSPSADLQIWNIDPTTSSRGTPLTGLFSHVGSLGVFIVLGILLCTIRAT